MLPNLFQILKSDSDVSAIVASRIYRHGDAPQDVTKPYITWFLVSGTPENNLSDPPPVDRMSCQVDCWHPTDLGIDDLAGKVRKALETAGHVTGIIINERDAETRLFRIAFQVDIWLNVN
jgi:hypothetical protein